MLCLGIVLGTIGEKVRSRVLNGRGVKGTGAAQATEGTDLERQIAGTLRVEIVRVEADSYDTNFWTVHVSVKNQSSWYLRSALFEISFLDSWGKVLKKKFVSPQDLKPGQSRIEKEFFKDLPGAKIHSWECERLAWATIQPVEGQNVDTQFRVTMSKNTAD